MSYVVYLCNSFEVTQISDDINMLDLHIEQHDTSLYKVIGFISKELLPNIQMEIKEFPWVRPWSLHSLFLALN